MRGKLEEKIKETVQQIKGLKETIETTNTKGKTEYYISVLLQCININESIKYKLIKFINEEEDIERKIGEIKSSEVNADYIEYTLDVTPTTTLKMLITLVNNKPSNVYYITNGIIEIDNIGKIRDKGASTLNISAETLDLSNTYCTYIKVLRGLVKADDKYFELGVDNCNIIEVDNLILDGVYFKELETLDRIVDTDDLKKLSLRGVRAPKVKTIDGEFCGINIRELDMEGIELGEIVKLNKTFTNLQLDVLDLRTLKLSPSAEINNPFSSNAFLNRTCIKNILVADKLLEEEIKKFNEPQIDIDLSRVGGIMRSVVKVDGGVGRIDREATRLKAKLLGLEVRDYNIEGILSIIDGKREIFIEGDRKLQITKCVHGLEQLSLSNVTIDCKGDIKANIFMSSNNITLSNVHLRNLTTKKEQDKEIERGLNFINYFKMEEDIGKIKLINITFEEPEGAKELQKVLRELQREGVEVEWEGNM